VTSYFKKVACILEIAIQVLKLTLLVLFFTDNLIFGFPFLSFFIFKLKAKSKEVYP